MEGLAIETNTNRQVAQTVRQFYGHPRLVDCALFWQAKFWLPKWGSLIGAILKMAPFYHQLAMGWWWW